MNVGDKVAMWDVERAVFRDVVVVEVWKGGHVVVEAETRTQGPPTGPAKRWLTPTAYLEERSP